jgi:hypothetical protein
MSVNGCTWTAETHCLWVEGERVFGYAYHQDLQPYYNKDVELRAVHPRKTLHYTAPRAEKWSQAAVFLWFFQQFKRIVTVAAKNRGKMGIKCVDDAYLRWDGITTDWYARYRSAVVSTWHVLHFFFQITPQQVDWERLETKVSHDVRLASHTTRLALAQRCLKIIKFSIVRWILKSLRAYFQACITSWHSSVHQRTSMHHGLVDDHGMELEAAWCKVLVKCSTRESKDGNSQSSKPTNHEKDSSWHIWLPT